MAKATAKPRVGLRLARAAVAPVTRKLTAESESRPTASTTSKTMSITVITSAKPARWPRRGWGDGDLVMGGCIHRKSTTVNTG